ncbi:TlpA family protein disulfide reductase [Belliella sp. DSM 111904]|uniref:TlpA family protein disulfide reductase n=1 Tax=Belliella filtrata TaxID=2923435 RepID=A0ABS9V4Q1_9BACT|nr:TlpA disulfide reductase family protein [Belliella filtrata]MCH7411382.1 TlpA family protein disulfide reductase [Belliella filtrata]
MKSFGLLGFSWFLVVVFLATNTNECCAQKKDLRYQGPEVGEKFPDFNLVTIDGDEISLAQMKEKVVVLNGWFVGCTGCKQEEPYLKEITKQFMGSNQVVFVGLAMSSPNRIRNYLSKRGDYGYLQVSVSRKEMEENFDIILSPSHFIIKNGVLIAKYTGPLVSIVPEYEWFKEEIAKAIDLK